MPKSSRVQEPSSEEMQNSFLELLEAQAKVKARGQIVLELLLESKEMNEQ